MQIEFIISVLSLGLSLASLVVSIVAILQGRHVVDTGSSQLEANAREYNRQAEQVSGLIEAVKALAKRR